MNKLLFAFLFLLTIHTSCSNDSTEPGHNKALIKVFETEDHKFYTKIDRNGKEIPDTLHLYSEVIMLERLFQNDEFNWKILVEEYESIACNKVILEDEINIIMRKTLLGEMTARKNLDVEHSIIKFGKFEGEKLYDKHVTLYTLCVNGKFLEITIKNTKDEEVGIENVLKIVKK